MCDPHLIYFFSSLAYAAGSNTRLKISCSLVTMLSVRLHEQYSTEAVLLYLLVMWSGLILCFLF